MYLRYRSLALLTALFALSCAPPKKVSPPPDPHPFDAALAAGIDMSAAETLTASASLGASVTVRRADGSVHVTGVGIADAATERAILPDDTFRGGSITKTFVASVILQLDEEGVLSIDDTVDRWVPGFAFGDSMKLRHLLTHTSGVFNYTDAGAAFLFKAVEDATPQEVIRWAIDQGELDSSCHRRPQCFDPGTDYSYSNTNFYLLGLTIEAATGKDLRTVLQERLFGPLALTHTTLEGTTVPTVEGFLQKSEAPPYSITWAWAAGAIVTTGSDLCRWSRALYLDGKVLPQARVDEMLADTMLPDGRHTSYGLGLQRFHRDGRLVVGHTGSTMGFRAEMFTDLSTEDCVVVMTNDFFGDPTAISVPVWKLLHQ